MIGKIVVTRRLRPGLLAVAAAAAVFILLSAAQVRPAAAADSCIDCHGELEGRLSDPLRNFDRGVHKRHGLSCASCHGGDPDDPDMTAMDPDKGFRGVPARPEIAEMCASCHANAPFMKRYNPRPYIFSLSEFRTSVHCKKIEEGDPKVATCTNCHGVHGILPHEDPRSPVHPTNVPVTCTNCHNADYMKGRSVRTDQLELYTESVHGHALLEKGDLSAPACNDCHGNHGAAPPGFEDLSLVCGTCHGRTAELFRNSTMHTAMREMGLMACVTCHGNHDVQRPTDEMLSSGDEGKCGGCHEPGSSVEAAADSVINGFHGLKEQIASADSLMHEAETLGMEVEHGRTQLREANDQLVGVRALLHSFNTEIIGTAIGEGEGFANQAAASATAALKDWRNRRIGMAASVVAILLMIVLLIARIRLLERRRVEGPEPTD